MQHGQGPVTCSNGFAFPEDAGVRAATRGGSLDIEAKTDGELRGWEVDFDCEFRSEVVVEPSR